MLQIQPLVSAGIEPGILNHATLRYSTDESVLDSQNVLFCFHCGHKSPCFSVVRFHWLQSSLASRAILKSHRTVHVPIGCYFTLQIPPFPRFNFNASKSLACLVQTLIIATYKKFNMLTPTHPAYTPSSVLFLSNEMSEMLGLIL